MNQVVVDEAKPDINRDVLTDVVNIPAHLNDKHIVVDVVIIMHHILLLNYALLVSITRRTILNADDLNFQISWWSLN